MVKGPLGYDQAWNVTDKSKDSTLSDKSAEMLEILEIACWKNIPIEEGPNKKIAKIKFSLKIYWSSHSVKSIVFNKTQGKKLTTHFRFISLLFWENFSQQLSSIVSVTHTNISLRGNSDSDWGFVNEKVWNLSSSYHATDCNQ